MSKRLTLPTGSRDHVQGSLDAPVVLVEYGDYQCPHCGRAYPIVKALQRHFGSELGFVFRNYPLTEAHPDALRAAETAEWAALGDQFWPMHDWLFEHQRTLGAEDLLAAAAAFGLDPHQLAAAWRDQTHRARVVEDLESGDASGVGGTPTFFINGVRHDGSWDPDTMVAAIDAARAHHQKR